MGRSEDPTCSSVYEPIDIPRSEPSLYNNPLKIMPAWLMFTEFMRFVDAPQPAPLSASAQRGKDVFNRVGCVMCHTASFNTAGTANPATQAEEIGPHSVALREQTVNLFSDLLLHQMGATLADNVIQGNAGPDEFRTTPLCGLGQRLFFLHDGRTTDLMVAIQDHLSDAGSDGGDNPAKDSQSPTHGASEANAVVRRFNGLPEREKQSLLDFLRSLQLVPILSMGLPGGEPREEDEDEEDSFACNVRRALECGCGRPIRGQMEAECDAFALSRRNLSNQHGYRN